MKTARDRLQELLRDWGTWAATASRDEDGWESSYPEWRELIAVAKDVLSDTHLTDRDIRNLATVFEISEEGEEIVRYLEDQAPPPVSALSRLIAIGSAATRWQVYASLSGARGAGEQLLRSGLEDADAYAKRRAVLALAESDPPDAGTLAQRFAVDPDPYIRQAALQFVGADPDSTWAAELVGTLIDDCVGHVREAALRKAARCKAGENR